VAARRVCGARVGPVSFFFVLIVEMEPFVGVLFLCVLPLFQFLFSVSFLCLI
jgi:hypothetical protein